VVVVNIDGQRTDVAGMCARVGGITPDRLKRALARRPDLAGHCVRVLGRLLIPLALTDELRAEVEKAKPGRPRSAPEAARA
jgi:hypothetical protein